MRLALLLLVCLSSEVAAVEGALLDGDLTGGLAVRWSLPSDVEWKDFPGTEKLPKTNPDGSVTHSASTYATTAGALVGIEVGEHPSDRKVGTLAEAEASFRQSLINAGLQEQLSLTGSRQLPVRGMPAYEFTIDGDLGGMTGTGIYRLFNGSGRYVGVFAFGRGSGDFSGYSKVVALVNAVSVERIRSSTALWVGLAVVIGLIALVIIGTKLLRREAKPGVNIHEWRAQTGRLTRNAKE